MRSGAETYRRRSATAALLANPFRFWDYVGATVGALWQASAFNEVNQTPAFFARAEEDAVYFKIAGSCSMGF
jgi:hypothetical protein